MKPILFIFAFVLILRAQPICSQGLVDEYRNIIPDDEFGHLGIFSEKLSTDTGTSGTIVIYKDKSESTGHFLRHFYGVSAFLTKVFKLSPNRFKTIYGGEGKRQTKLFIDHTGSSILQGEELDETLRGKISKNVLFDRECIDCDPVVFINGFIFREGMEYLARALLANPATFSVVTIGRVQFLSGTPREQRELRNEIYNSLSSGGLDDLRRVKLRFVRGSFASVRIVPIRRSRVARVRF